MPSCRLLGFPTWFWSSLVLGGLVLAAIVLQPWCNPLLLVEDVPQLANEYLEHQHHHPGQGLMHLPWLAGLLNQLGVLLFCSAGVVCLFTVRILVRHQARLTLTGFLAGAGLLSLLLGLDDVFMVHETVHKRIGGVTAKLFTVAYASALLALLWSNRREILQSTEWRVLLVSLACFGLSEVIANLRVLNQCRLHWRVWDPSPARTLCEEGLKWFGVVLWFAYLLDTAANHMTRRQGVRGG
jgi:hypothetical protein